MATAAAYEKVSTSSHIHNDIAFSILSKLPIKSLTRFTCVQKSWSLLFQNPLFMDKFRANFLAKHDEDNNYDNTRLLLNERVWTPTSIQDNLYTLSSESFKDRVKLDWPPPFQYDHSFINILCSASVNGILCLSKCFNDHITIALWNPATGEFKIVPRSHLPYENIVYNPPPYAFGYDHGKDDFKVIRFALYPKSFEDKWVLLPEKDSSFWQMKGYDHYLSWKEIQLDMYDPFLELYSLRSNSWRKLDGVDPMLVTKHGRSQVNLNEFCHWLGRNNDLVSFDFSNEIFYATTLPSFDFGKETSFERRMLNKNLVVLNGFVAFIYTVFNTGCLHIWVCGELGVIESWIKLFVIGPLPCIMRPISVGIKSVLFYLKENMDRACFDLSTQRIEEVWIRGKRARLQIIIYKENLLSMGGMNN